MFWLYREWTIPCLLSNEYKLVIQNVLEYWICPFQFYSRKCHSFCFEVVGHHCNQEHFGFNYDCPQDLDYFNVDIFTVPKWVILYDSCLNSKWDTKCGKWSVIQRQESNIFASRFSSWNVALVHVLSCRVPFSPPSRASSQIRHVLGLILELRQTIMPLLTKTNRDWRQLLRCFAQQMKSLVGWRKYVISVIPLCRYFRITSTLRHKFFFSWWQLWYDKLTS